MPVPQRAKRFKYPYKRLEPAAPLSRTALRALAIEGARGGAGKPARPVPKRFEAKIRANHENEKAPSVAHPRWLYAMKRRRAEKEEIFENVLRVVRRAPKERSFRMAQAALNELGRKRGGAFLRKALTQEVVDEFLDRGE